MYYTYKNGSVTVEGSGIAVIDARLSLNAFTEPLYLSSERHALFYNAIAPVGGTMTLSYYLTGQDNIKTFITNESNPISGNFGGLYFTSGYLKSYRLNCVPNNPVIVNAEIVFYQGLSGTFAPTYIQATGTKILNYCDILLVDPSFGALGSISGINSLALNFESDIQPLYVAGDSLPTSITFGKKELNASFTVDIYSGYLPITGISAGVQINFTHPGISNLTESFTVSGHLYKRDFEASLGDFVRPRLFIKQGFSKKKYQNNRGRV